MRIARHQLSVESLVSIANGRAGPDTLRAVVRARRSRNLLVLAAIVDQARRMDHPQAPAGERGFQRLAEIEQTAPAAVSTVLHHPPVAEWAFHTLRQLNSDSAERADPGQLTAVAAAAAIRAGVHIDIDVAVDYRSGQRVVRLPTLGSARMSSPGPVRLRGSGANFEIVGARERVVVPADPHRAGNGWRGLPRITARHESAGIALLLDILEGDAASHTTIAEDELDSIGAVQEWQGQLDSTWRLLVRHHTRVAVEVGELISVLVPLSAPPRGTASATPSDAFGAVALTRPHDPVWFALSLAHEVQHVKLTAVTDLFPLLDAAQDGLFYAPWRADPRPAFGLMHGMYAHLGVADFWRRQREVFSGLPAELAEIEFARWRAAAREVGDTLRTAVRLTAEGRIFLDGMMEAADELCAIPVSAAAVKAATRSSAAHRRSWLATNGDGHKI